MSTDYVGVIVLSFDGTDYDIESIDTTDKTGRKAVKTMNRTGGPKGSAKGVREHPIKLTAPIPVTGEPDWWNMKDAKITIEPLDCAAKTVTYSGFSVEEVGSKYQQDGEAKRDISGFALKRVEE
jgi:hypothetical protein